MADLQLGTRCSNGRKCEAFLESTGSLLLAIILRESTNMLLDDIAVSFGELLSMHLNKCSHFDHQ